MTQSRRVESALALHFSAHLCLLVAFHSLLIFFFSRALATEGWFLGAAAGQSSGPMRGFVCYFPAIRTPHAKSWDDAGLAAGAALGVPPQLFIRLPSFARCCEH